MNWPWSSKPCEHEWVEGTVHKISAYNINIDDIDDELQLTVRGKRTDICQKCDKQRVKYVDIKEYVFEPTEVNDLGESE